jgi:hypothetical protein
MKEFTFRAPTLYDASATASEAEKEAWHDAPGAADYGAKTKKFALWLKSEMVKMGLAANGPYADEGNWMIDVPADGGGFSLCIISGSVGDDPLFNVLVSEIGGAPKDVGDVIEDILHHARVISELKVE